VTVGGLRVAATSGERIPYVVPGPDGRRVEPVTDYLTELLAGDLQPADVAGGVKAGPIGKFPKADTVDNSFDNPALQPAGRRRQGAS
jgi:hypothetical protein